MQQVTLLKIPEKMIRNSDNGEEEIVQLRSFMYNQKFDIEHDLSCNLQLGKNVLISIGVCCSRL
jgi:hypothetical protein